MFKEDEGTASIEDTSHSTLHQPAAASHHEKQQQQQHCLLAPSTERTLGYNDVDCQFALHILFSHVLSTQLSDVLQ